jgi:diguanylate cyclase (GGDEF)-like protein/PAS domain S-box-containing protein
MHTATSTDLLQVQRVVTRVLLVEDSPGDARLVRTALGGGRCDVEVVWVESLQAATRHATAMPPDCALLDLGLPDADGFEALEEMRRTAPAVPVVVLTGDGDPQRGVEAVRRGADDYVQKADLSSRMLLQTVEFAVERHRARRALRRSESFARSVLAGLSEGVVVHDLDGALVTANATASAVRARAMTPGQHRLRAGWRLERLDGSPVRMDESATTVACRTRGPVSGDVVALVAPDGSRTVFETNAHLLVDDEHREPYAVVTSYRDVTSRIETEREIRFQAALLDAAGQAIVASDEAGLVVYWNRAAAAMFGWTDGGPRGRDADAVMGLSWTPAQRDARQHALDSGAAWGAETSLAPNGGPHYAALTYTALRDAAGRRTATITVASDVTERTLAQEATHRLSAIVDGTADAVIGTEPDGTITSWNAAAQRMFGWTAAEVVGRGVGVLIGAGDADDTSLLLRSIERGEAVKNVETVRTRRDGARVSVSITVSPVYDTDGTLAGTSTIARDITDRNRILGELRHSALHDALTGLPNRQLLGDRLLQGAARARRHGGAVAVLFVDLDHFKLINDAAGHAVGDRVLVEVAARITGAVRADDTVARFGGDEFVVVCADGSVGTVSGTAERILAALREPLEVDDQRLHVSASIGVALAPPTDVESILSSADAAMYDAKARGRAQVRMFDETLAQEATQRLELSNDLRDALASDELELHYQPIVDLATGALIGLEALARWHHPRHGMLPPEQFIGLADEIGLSGVLDRWALRTGTRDIAALRARGAVPAGCSVSVNVTARSLRDPALEHYVGDIVRHAQLPPGSLVMELTETGLMDDPDEARELLVRLRDSGVGVAIDDFGTGYSSLAYLGRFSVATLKIDRSFVERMLDSHDDLAIVAAISDLSRAVGVRTVAEGIETPEQAELLRRLGAHAGQGFLWSAAVPAADVGALVARQPRGRFRVACGPVARADARDDDELAGLLPVHGFTRLLALHRDGASPSSIAAALNNEGFRTPRGNRWHRHTVVKALDAAVNPFVRVARTEETR